MIVKTLGKIERRDDLISFLKVLPSKRDPFLGYIIIAIRDNVVTKHINEYLVLNAKYLFEINFDNSNNSEKQQENAMKSTQVFKIVIEFTDKLTDTEKQLLILEFLGSKVTKVNDLYRVNGQTVNFSQQFQFGLKLIQDEKIVTFIKTNDGLSIQSDNESAKRFWSLLSSLSHEMIQRYIFVPIETSPFTVF